MAHRFTISKIHLLVGSAALTALLLTGPAFAKDKYEKWFEEEVCWIISKAEREEFKSLNSDTLREGFVEDFWKRRDPSPSTDRNEYKEEHYRRLEFAKKMFREGTPGWKTDRGRVYILHGPPDSESFYNSRSAISPNRQLPHTMRSPKTIVWVYHQNPTAKYYGGEMRLVFQPSSGLSRQNFALSESKTAQDRADQLSRRFFPASDPNWLEADARYKLVMAGPPTIVNSSGADLPTAGLGESNRYMEDFLRSPGELLEEQAEELARRERSKEELRATARAEISFGEVPFELEAQGFARPSGDWLVPVRLNIGLGEAVESKLDVYAALLDDSGEVFDEFIDSVDLDLDVLKQSGAEAVNYLNSFFVPSGQYLLRVAVRGVASKRTGLREDRLSLSAGRNANVRLSGVLLTNRVEVLPEGEETQAGAYTQSIVFNQARLLPSPSLRFSRDGYLFAFLQVWPSSAGAKVSLSGKFIRDGQIVGKLETRILDPLQSNYAEYGTAMPLNTFETGAYTLQFQVIDYQSKTFDIERVSFTLVEAPAGPASPN